MKKKVIVISIFLALLITTVSTSALKIQNNNFTQSSVRKLDSNDDAVLPIWNIGDSWTYDCVMNGGLEDFINLNNLRFNDLKFEVIEVLDDFYKMDMSGGIFGSVTLNLGISLSGSLRSTTVEGSVYVNKSNLFVEEVENFLMSGYIKPGIGPQIAFEVDGKITLFHGKTLLDFPINRADIWIVDEISANINASITVAGLLSDEVDITIFIQDHSMKCDKWDNLEIDAGNYDALKITKEDTSPLTDEKHNIWYSPAAGNIVKVESKSIPFSWGGWGYYDIDMELVSTTFEPDTNPPNIPDMPDGPEVIDVGIQGSYESSATDPDDDIIRLIFDWGDGEYSYSDFVESGEIVSVTHTWTTTQTDPFVVRVKARDKYGVESDWSEGISVTVINTAPGIPDIPNGPESGRIRKTYTYSSVSTDPEGHRIKYGWDFNGDLNVDTWTGLYNSGQEASASWTWNSKDENIEIRVKARDEYGSESDFSDPLVVSMPKNKNINLLSNLLNLFQDRMPRLHSILLFLSL